MEKREFFCVDYSELEAMEEASFKNLEQLAVEEPLDPTVYPDPEFLTYPENVYTLEMELDYFDAEKQEEKLWQARTGLTRETLCGAIETLIFMSDRPISLAKIKRYIDEDIPLRAIHEAIVRLQSEYEQKHHGIRLMEVAEGYQFRTKATYSHFVQKLFNVNSLALTPTALEVLAIIAYKQPVSKSEIDKIRGVDSSHIVRGLMDKRLVKVEGRSEELGRPALYGTTLEFMEVFNLSDLSQLPPEYELEDMAQESIGKISDIKGLVHSGDKAQFNFDEIDELDELSASIKLISTDTDFIRSIKQNEKVRVQGAEESNSSTEKRSAFDLLEEFILKDQVSRVNKEAVSSETFTAITQPEIITSLENGPFNLPEDLDLEDLELSSQDSKQENEEEFNWDLEREELASALDGALDEAFDRLMDKSDSDFEDLETESEDWEELDSAADGIDSWAQETAAKAKEMHLDLDFLKEDSESKNTE